ncbi:MAG: hypothetical protein IJ064_07295 [Bacteroidaceae bacterium]|nr:hypothetical protein [Bacteroidaceae bacterium]
MKKTISNLAVVAGMAMALCLTSCEGNGSKGSEGEALADTLLAEDQQVTAEQEQAQSEATEVAAAETVTAEEPAALNTALLGHWTNGGDGDAIALVVSDKYGTYDGNKGYGYVSATVEYEPAFTLVFTSLTPDGDRIRVHYNKMETYYEGGGDPDDFGAEDYGEWVTRKAGEGDLTLIPANGRLKIESRENLIRNKTLHK